MAERLAGQRIAFLAADGVEQVELTEPWKAVQQAGGTPTLISLKAGEIQGFNHLDKGDRFPVDLVIDRADPDSFDALVLPGGVANPDQLRADDRAVKFARAMFESSKPIGVICHGPWLLVEADAVRGRTLTSWPSLQTDIRNAGGVWVDEEVVTDTRLVSSRGPQDLPAFCARIVEEFAEARRS